LLSRIAIYVATLIMVAILHHPAAALLFLFSDRAPVAFLPDLVPSTWAAEVTPATADAPLSQQGSKPSADTIPGPEKPAAQEPPVDAKQPQLPVTPAKPQEPQPNQGIVDELHSDISRSLLTTAVWLDSFFVDDRAIKEENRSYLRARYEIFYEDRTSPSYKPTVSLRLVLPQLQKKTHLVFSSESNDTLTSSATPASLASERPATTPTGEERNFMGALDYFYRSTLKESVVIRTGALFSHGSPVLFIAPRYRSLIPFDPWSFRFTEEVTWRTDTSWESDTIIDFERSLPRDFFFRTSLSGVWTAKATGYLYYLSFTLRQPLGPAHALDYEWINSFQTRPVGELTDIAYIVRYRHSVWRDWLFFEVAPQVRFPRDRNYDATPGILFKFEMFFGKNA